jgi:hypothetical protein
VAASARAVALVKVGRVAAASTAAKAAHRAVAIIVMQVVMTARPAAHSGTTQHSTEAHQHMPSV